MARFALIPEGDFEYDYEDEESDFSALQSQDSGVSAPFFRRDVNSPATSVYSQPISRGLYDEPRNNEQSIQSALNRQNNSFTSLVLNSLTKEIVNAKFLVEEISFGQLTKIQKQKLMRIMVRINKVKDIIKNGIGKPIYSNLNSVFKMIQIGLSSEGNNPITDERGNKIRDLTSSEFLLNTATSMPPEEAGEIEAFGSGRKRRMLSPAMFNAHNYDPYNVNCNFALSLAKRNI